MAGESCNLDKDEAEIFKPSSSTPSASPPSPPPPSSSAPSPAQPSLSSSVHLKSCEDCNIPRPESLPPAPIAVSSSPEIYEDPPKASEEPWTPVRFGNRCSTCQRKVGLTGFRCRCGDLFCGRHRYSDAHDCSFDYKAAGREEIAKANPLIKAAKIIKI